MEYQKRVPTRPSMAVVATLLAAAAAFCAAPALGSGESGGEIRFGYRFVDVDGSQEKFDEDIHLEEGPRLFELHLGYRPTGEHRKIDRIQLDLDGFGGDPFSSLAFSLARRGRYDLRVRRTESRYFYEDIYLPTENATPHPDFSTFDFERMHDRVSFELKLRPEARLLFGFDRYTRRGESTMSIDIQRDEFELDRPIDETASDLRLAFEYAWDKVTLTVEEQVRDFESEAELFLPGASEGEDTGDPSQLDFFFLDQPYEYQSFRHTVRANARPSERLRLRARASLESLDLDLRGDERSQGTTFRGDPFTTDLEAEGEIGRDTELFDLDLSYRIGEKTAVTGTLRRQSLDQDGAFTFDVAGASWWETDILGLELGVEYAPSPRLSLAVGGRREERDVASETLADDEVHASREETSHLGFFARAAWRPAPGCRLDAEIEESTYDDPFTRSSPTDRLRLTLRGRWRLEGGLYLQGSVLAHRFENDSSGWEADRDQLSLRLGYRRDRVDLSVGGARLEADRSIDQEVITNPGFNGGILFLFPIRFEADTEIYDGRIRWRPTERWSFGAQARFYDSEGSFQVARDDLRAFAELALDGGYLLSLAYRDVDYEEGGALDPDDYRADVLELGVGYRW